MEAFSAPAHPSFAPERPPSDPTIGAPAEPEHPIDGVVRCGCCRRFPLVGESVTRHVGRGGDEWACASCEADGRGARLGEPAESDRVRSIGGASNVRRAA